MERHPSPHHLSSNTEQPEEASVEMITDCLIGDATGASPTLAESSHTIIPAVITPKATHQGAEDRETLNQIVVNKNHPAFITKVYTYVSPDQVGPVSTILI
jgi:hypothetical protein